MFTRGRGNNRLGTTWVALTRGTAYGGVTIGAWTAWPKNGTTGIDPYARAMVVRTGELPVGSGDGVAFYASMDDAGESLDGRCDVLVSGITPQARFWTLTLYDPEGHLVANSIRRQGFTSQEIIRKADGAFDVAVGPRARPGNWLPTGGVDKYQLVLRLLIPRSEWQRAPGRTRPCLRSPGGDANDPARPLASRRSAARRHRAFGNRSAAAERGDE
jgi:hypothetical protein